MTKWVYRFGDGTAEGRAEMKNLLGGKGAGLAEMNNLELPVPPGFTITTEVCTYYYMNGKSFPAELRKQVGEALAEIEQSCGARFGDPGNPLLVSVRSGARVSMPGMMDTVLNLGLNDRVVEGLARQSGDERFAYDSYRRFIQMYGQVVLGIENHFEQLLEMVLDTEHHLSVHLNEAAIAVICEAFVAALARQPLDHPVVEPEVQHRVHHARHRDARAGAHRHEKRVVGVPEPCAKRTLDPGRSEEHTSE